ncbi:hypothetical protein R4B61_01335 [Fructilactobacillus vespulae]|uniref:hypothetical protein n=1 Tax=Fructilactobacillus vespulae TaxID=1249630 RepID=UPI0039B680E2
MNKKIAAIIAAVIVIIIAVIGTTLYVNSANNVEQLKSPTMTNRVRVNKASETSSNPSDKDKNATKTDKKDQFEELQTADSAIDYLKKQLGYANNDDIIGGGVEKDADTGNKYFLIQLKSLSAVLKNGAGGTIGYYKVYPSGAWSDTPQPEAEKKTDTNNDNKNNTNNNDKDENKPNTKVTYQKDDGSVVKKIAEQNHGASVVNSAADATKIISDSNNNNSDLTYETVSSVNDQYVIHATSNKMKENGGTGSAGDYLVEKDGTYYLITDVKVE